VVRDVVEVAVLVFRRVVSEEAFWLSSAPVFGASLPEPRGGEPDFLGPTVPGFGTEAEILVFGIGLLEFRGAPALLGPAAPLVLGSVPPGGGAPGAPAAFELGVLGVCALVGVAWLVAVLWAVWVWRRWVRFGATMV